MSSTVTRTINNTNQKKSSKKSLKHPIDIIAEDSDGDGMMNFIYRKNTMSNINRYDKDHTDCIPMDDEDEIGNKKSNENSSDDEMSK